MGVELGPISWVHSKELNRVAPCVAPHRSRPDPYGPLLTRKPKLEWERLSDDIRLCVGHGHEPLLGKIDGAAQIGVAIEEFVEEEVHG